MTVVDAKVVNRVELSARDVSRTRKPLQDIEEIFHCAAELYERREDVELAGYGKGRKVAPGEDEVREQERKKCWE